MSDLADRIGKLSPARVTLLALELQEQLTAAQERTREPIAVIGMACRLPGHANSPSAYWRLLRDGVDAVTEVPRERWDASAYYDPRQDAAGKMKTRWGGFIDDVDRFDAGLFGIAPREAVSLDPQQRLLLETSWAALEDAGQAPDRLHGSQTGVFVGIGTSDYSHLLAQALPVGEIDAYRATGCISHSPASGRVAYVFGLQGPAVSVDTACSSSLSAIHLACQSLHLDECSMALAGGVNVVLLPELGISLSKAGMMASDGRCKTFDASADGFVRGEGCGVIVLKRLSAALADGDRVLAVIRGSALNQDGRSNGLTAPNGPAQEAVIRAALDNAGVRPDEVSFIEAHGTGTELGDPIELQALGRALRGTGSERVPLHLGAGKSNLGHLEAAAGVAGLIKLVLSLQHGQIPPNLHFRTPNPHVNWEDFPFHVPTALQPWAPPSGRRIAGVSSFGFSGTNAHVVVEEPPVRQETRAAMERPLHVLTVSARSESSLRTSVERYAEQLEQGGASLADICFTANTGRAQLGRRLAIVAGSLGELRERLDDARHGRPSPAIVRGEVRPGEPRRVAMLFTGQGAQYAAMGRGLYESQPRFRAAIDQCAEILRSHVDVPLVDLLNGTGGDINATEYAQPALFAVGYALADLWKSWGVEPFVVMGHSVGEYVAACVAGLFSLEDGLRLVAARGRLMGALPAGGAMAAVLGPAARVAAAVAATPGTAVAAFNGPLAQTVAGEAEALERLQAALAAEGVSSQRLSVSHAFHSSRLDPMLDAFEAAAGSVRWLAPRIGIISNLTGRLADPAELSTPRYWRRHAREAVQFEKGMQTLGALAPDAVIEAGPHPTLIALGRDCVPETRGPWVGSLRRGREDWSQVLESIALLWTAGVPIDWRGFDRDYPRQRVAVPTYPFERSRYWFDTELPSLTAGQVPAPDRAAADSETAGPFYSIVWERSDAFPEDAVATDRSTPLRTVAELGAVAGGALAQRHDFDAYERSEPLVDGVCASFVYAALVQLGWCPVPGQCTSSGELADALGVQVRHRRLFERLLGMLAEDGLLERRGSIWRVLDREAPADAQVLLHQLRALEPSLDAELRLLQRCGAALASVLEGKSDPLPLLFPDGESADLEAIYGSSPAARVFNGSIAAIVTAEAQARTAPLRVLEIGAGTGSTTTHLFSQPGSAAVDYTFTDVSPYLVGRARHAWADRPAFRAAVLDIETDPDAQGFDGRRFDVVVAANVLHATTDLSRTLQHVRRLLAPGGLLVLYESVRAQRWVDLVFGLTDGWWKFTDLTLRPDSPLITGRQWTSLLAQHGFGEADTWSPATTGMPSAHALVTARTPALPRPAAADCGEWLIFADRAGLSEAVAAALPARGGSCIVVRDGSRFERSAEDEYRVRRNHLGDLDALFRDLDARQRSPQVVLWLNALDAALVDNTTSDVEQAQIDTGMALVRCVVRTGARSSAGGARLWIVTRGAQQPLDIESGDGVALGQAPIWGWGRVARLEYPQHWGGLIDLPPAPTPADAAMVLRMVTAGGDEDLVAVRAGVPYVPRLRPLPVPDSSRLELDADGVYLVTGGLGSMGLRVAQWMADRGARHVLLLGRSGALTGERGRAVEQLRRRGVTVRIVEADVADETRLTELVAEIRSEGRALRGVVHAAGVVTLTPLEAVTEENLGAHMHPKVAGAWALHRVTRHETLDFFVLCASAAGIWGSKGLGPYAAANQFLDALAHYRRAQGLPALTVDWGRWEGRGLVRDEEHRWYDALGLLALTPEDGISALERLIRSGASQATVARVDWSRFTSVYASAASDAFLRVVTRRVQRSTPAELSPDTSGRPVSGGTPPPSPLAGGLASIAEYLQARLAQTLGLPVQDVPLDESVNFLGLDSLMAIRLRDCIQTDYGVMVSAADFLKGQTVHQLAQRIAHQVGSGEAAGRAATVPAVNSEESAAVDAMSEADVNRLLIQLLAEDRTHG